VTCKGVRRFCRVLGLNNVKARIPEDERDSLADQCIIDDDDDATAYFRVALSPTGCWERTQIALPLDHDTSIRPTAPRRIGRNGSGRSSRISPIFAWPSRW
jgi:hypothetical protein